MSEDNSDDSWDRTWQDFFDTTQDEVLPRLSEEDALDEKGIEFFDEILDENRDLDRANELMDEWLGDDENGGN